LFCYCFSNAHELLCETIDRLFADKYVSNVDGFSIALGRRNFAARGQVSKHRASWLGVR